MYKDLTNEEIITRIEKHQEKVKELNKLVEAERAKIINLKKELDGRSELNKDRIVDLFSSQLHKNKNNVDLISYAKLREEILYVNNTLKHPVGSRKYGYGSLVESVYFNIGKLISRKIKNVGQHDNFMFQDKQFTIKFKFDKKSNIVSTVVTTDLFSERVEFCSDVVYLKEDKRLMKKSITKYIPKQCKYDEIIPSMVELVKFIEDRFESIVLGVYLSQK